MTITTDTLELARNLAAEHHPRCAARVGDPCDCYAADRVEYRLARAVVELVDGEDATVRKVVGYLTAALPELHRADCAVVSEKIDEALLAVRAAA